MFGKLISQSDSKLVYENLVISDSIDKVSFINVSRFHYLDVSYILSAIFGKKLSSVEFDLRAKDPYTYFKKNKDENEYVPLNSFKPSQHDSSYNSWLKHNIREEIKSERDAEELCEGIPPAIIELKQPSLRKKFDRMYLTGKNDMISKYKLSLDYYWKHICVRGDIENSYEAFGHLHPLMSGDRYLDAYIIDDNFNIITITETRIDVYKTNDKTFNFNKFMKYKGSVFIINRFYAEIWNDLDLAVILPCNYALHSNGVRKPIYFNIIEALSIDLSIFTFPIVYKYFRNVNISRFIKETTNGWTSNNPNIRFQFSFAENNNRSQLIAIINNICKVYGLRNKKILNKLKSISLNGIEFFETFGNDFIITDYGYQMLIDKIEQVLK